MKKVLLVIVLFYSQFGPSRSESLPQPQPNPALGLVLFGTMKVEGASVERKLYTGGIRRYLAPQPRKKALPSSPSSEGDFCC